jgi:hypothetical protein
VTETLNITEEDKNASLRLKKEISEKSKDILTPSKNAETIPKKRVDSLVSKLENVIKNSKPNEPNYKEFVNRYNDIMSLYNKQNGGL